MYELHGNVERWQCAGVRGSEEVTLSDQCDVLWRADPNVRFTVDAETMRTVGHSTVARCRACGGKARPNVLMFHDQNWLPNVQDEVRGDCGRGVVGMS